MLMKLVLFLFDQLKYLLSQ